MFSPEAPYKVGALVNKLKTNRLLPKGNKRIIISIIASLVFVAAGLTAWLVWQTNQPHPLGDKLEYTGHEFIVRFYTSPSLEIQKNYPQRKSILLAFLAEIMKQQRDLCSALLSKDAIIPS